MRDTVLYRASSCFCFVGVVGFFGWEWGGGEGEVVLLFLLLCTLCEMHRMHYKHIDYLKVVVISF